MSKVRDPVRHRPYRFLFPSCSTPRCRYRCQRRRRSWGKYSGDKPGREKDDEDGDPDREPESRAGAGAGVGVGSGRSGHWVVEQQFNNATHGKWYIQIRETWWN